MKSYSLIFAMYTLRQMLKSLFIVGVSFTTVVIFIDFMNLYATYDYITLTDLISLELYKTADFIQSLMPYIILLSFMHGFYKLNSKNEIIAGYSAGLSTFQIVLPVSLLAFVIGLIFTLLLNHIAIITYNQYEQLLSQKSKSTQTTINTSSNGIWIREATKDGYRIINSKIIIEPKMLFKGVNIINLGHNNIIIKSFSADTAILNNSGWNLSNVTETSTNKKSGTKETVILKTKITKDMIIKMFTKANEISFWNLSAHIDQLKSAGLNAKEHIFILHSLLSTPLLFMALAMIAGYFTARPFTRESPKKTITIGIMSAFILMFYLNISKSSVFLIPLSPYLLGWIPTISVFLIAVFLLLSSEKVRT